MNADSRNMSNLYESVVKSFSERSENGILVRAETFIILKIIVKKENEILNHDVSYNSFFDSFIAMSAESITQLPSKISQSKLQNVLEATNIIIRYIVNRFDSPNAPLVLLKALKSLCDCVVSADSSVCTSLKYLKYPENSKSNGSGSDKDSPKSEVKRSRSELSIVIMQQLTQPLSQGTTPLTNFSETQFDLTELFRKEVLDQLKALNASDVLLKWCITSIPIITPTYTLKYDNDFLSLQTKSLHLPQSQSEASNVKQCFKQMDIDINNILTVLQLPIMEPLTIQKIQQLSQLSMSSLYCCIITSITNSILMASSSSASTQTALSKSSSATTQQSTAGTAVSPKETTSIASSDNIDINEDAARNIVDKSLEIFKIVGEIFKKSAQNFVYQNHICMGAWMLLTGIQGAMSGSSTKTSTQLQTPEDFTKGKSPAKHSETPPMASAPPAPQPRVNLFKVQQSFGVLNAAIARHSIILLEVLLNEFKIDSSNEMENTEADDILITQQNQQLLPDELVNFNILKQHTSLERIMCVFSGTTLQQLLTFLATISYRKACNLKHLIEAGGEQLSFSDSTTYFNDNLSTEDESETDDEDDEDVEEEEDSESYLGSWLKETLSPEGTENAPDNNDKQSQEDNQKATNNSVPAKDEPHEYLELASQIFVFLDSKLGDNENRYLVKYVKHGLSEQQMVLLANILKDLDRDTAFNNSVIPVVANNASSSNDANNSAIQWNSSMMKFSSSIGKYMHNSISNSLLSESLQSLLLQNLGVSPWQTESNTWPLEVYSRTLAVVVQILLLKPSQEKEAACLSVWHRLVNTLVEGVCSSNVSQDEYEDLNVEHAQLLLFLFHSLNLMQKKSILLLVAGGVIRCAEVCRTVTPEKPLRDNQLILLSRLLLFLEYLMKHLYSPPNILLEQVSWNLFSIFSVDSEEKTAGLLSYKSKMQSFCRKDLEDRYRKLSTVHDGITIKPKLYSLTVIDSAKQNDFKLDGLAWNFILCTPDKVKYPLLIDSLINIMNITDMSTAKIPYHSQFSIYYCFNLAWKLLLGLPPSTSHIENLISAEDRQVTLHTLLWSTRCLKPVSSGVHSHNLIVDCLIRQGMYTQAAETMWTNLTEKLSDMNHVLTLAKYGLESFLVSFYAQNPRISKIILLDSLLTHLVSYQTSASISDTENNKPPKARMNAHLCADIMERLMQSVEILIGLYFKTMAQSLTGQVPQKIMESLIAVSDTKNTLTGELSEHLLSSIQTTDKDVLTNEWKRNLGVIEDTIPASTQMHPEGYTLNIIEAHVAEIYRHPTYSILLSLKQAIQSIMNWILYLLPNYDEGRADHRLRDLLVPLLFDLRTEYLYDLINKCLESITGGDFNSESYQLLSYKHILQHTYNIVIEYCELSVTGNTKPVNIDENALHEIIKYWESLLDKPNGLKALREFFFDQKNGNLVNILLSFTGTNLTQQYSTKVLKYFEKLFQTSEHVDSVYPIDEVCGSLSDLGTVDPTRLRNWLSHILLGPKGSGDGGLSSETSSNVPTPTNLGTQSSAAPSLPVDKQKSPASVNPDPDAMEIDEECSRIAMSSVFWTPIIQNSATTNEPAATVAEPAENNGKLLQILTKFLVTENRVSAAVSQSLFQALVQLGNNILASTSSSSQQSVPDSVLVDFTALLQVMITLADADQGKGHSLLFPSAVEWLDTCKNRVLDKYNKSNIPTITFSSTAGSTTKIQLDNVSSLLKYMSDLLIGLNGQQRPNSGTWEDDVTFDIEELIMSDPSNTATGGIGTEEDEDVVEDGEEGSASKLCTYTVTQKDFMNQHWYWCYTCKMENDKGCCSVCARVCHKNHDVVYAKYGNFYCDCGAKEDGSCQAMSMLDNSNSTNQTSALEHSEHVLVSSLKRRSSSTTVQPSNDIINNLINNKQVLAKIIEASKDSLNNNEMWRNVLKCLLSFCHNLMPVIKDNCAKYSTVGCHSRAKNALERLHQPEKSFNYSEKVMIATLGSQEGAFENVRMNYSGDQGQTIRQLLSSNLIRRVALCCLASSPHSKRQHLAVSHEKGKVTILQLSALLKQADAAKKKLTLTRLSSIPITCMVLSLAANPANEDFLAVCGLRECHVLTFTATGTVHEHIVLTLQLENGNFLRRAIWLPGSQTKLALVTAEFVKIYDLAEDSLSPKYYFVVPSGDIRDVTFVLQEETYFMLIMSSLGYIYSQPLSDESLATHGAFYVTNTLELDHSYIRDVNGQILAGGVSIYYSHTLQILFFSYAMGKSFMAPLVDVNDGVKCVINLLHSAKIFSKGSTNSSQPLCQWMEVQGHPGLVCAMMQNSNNPVIFMLKPDGYVVQEIKAQNPKAKIMDMVAIRHSVSGVEKTTLILLCEDGSLRIYAANQETTNYWLSPEIQPIGNYYNSGISGRGNGKKKAKKSTTKQLAPAGAKAVGTVATVVSAGLVQTFPVDFFEHCTALHEVEYGGNDLLEIYNQQQLQQRLSTSGFYVASTRTLGFTLEVTNKDVNMVITGVRFLIGSQDLTRAPAFVSVLGRRVPLNCTRGRWYGIPLTRDESLQSDKKLSIHFGPSQDPEFVTMLDGIKIYGKTKELFGWPDEIFDGITDPAAAGTLASGLCTSSIVVAGESAESQSMFTITALDKMITTMLDVIDNGLYLLGGSSVDISLKQQAIDVTTALILLPTPGVVQQLARSVLATLHTSKSQYHSYKDSEILNDINNEIVDLLGVRDYKNVDPEGFYRIILMVRNIAVQRPQQLVKICQENSYSIVDSLMYLIKELHKISPSHEESTVIVHYGLAHKEATIQALIEIYYAFIYSDSTMIDAMTKFMVELLVDSDSQISHSAKYAIIRLLRPKFKRTRKVLIDPTVTPPGCHTPTPQSQDDGAASIQEVDLIEPLGLIAAGGGNENLELNVLEPIEALLGMAGVPPLGREENGEALMEFALELYLQEYDGDITAFQGLANRLRSSQAFQAVAAAAGIDLDPSVPAGQEGSNNNTGRVNNSAGGSDDDDEDAEAGSNAATDGSNLRTSPTAEQMENADGGSGNASESGGSGSEIGGISGRSSTYEESVAQSGTHQSPPKSTTTNTPPQTGKQDENAEEAADLENLTKLHALRIAILEKMVENFSALGEVTGRQIIPLMQVILMLTTDLDGNQEAEKNIMVKLMNACVVKLEMNPPTHDIQLSHRTPKSEVQLILLRFVGIIMGKIKSLTSKTGTASSATTLDNIQFVASTTASVLMRSGAIVYCLGLLESFLPYWKVHPGTTGETSGSGNNAGSIITTSAGTPTVNNLLKPTLYGTSPDMQPFFARQYIKGHYNDIFELYPQVLTEMAVRLPYQIMKLASSGSNTSSTQQHSYDSAQMTYTLCEYMMYLHSPILRRQVRKLLLYMCGNKERYRKLRDLHSLNEHMKAIKQCCSTPTGTLSIAKLNHQSLSYQTLVSLVEHLRNCYEIASARTGNWQRFCLLNTDILASLLGLSCHQFDESISSIILQLLQAAVVSMSPPPEPPTATGAQVKANKERKERDKSEEFDNGAESKFDPGNCNLLVQQIFNQVPVHNLTLFIKTFLLETNSAQIRWLAHGLIYAFYENSNEANKNKLLQCLWGLWPLLPAYGKRTPQFVDLIGFFTLNTKSTMHTLPEKITKAVKVLREQNELVAKHPNAPLYSALSQVLDLDGFYLESEPCLVCNNTELPMSIIKLQSIKVDSKFTTNSNIIKLVNSHTISKIILRIADLKRSKMVRTINIYYNSRNVQAVVELKNRPAMWIKAKSVLLQSGQTDVKIDLSLPITACNLMFEYEDFFETATSLPESLQCPRCSATVPANPGVCSNCGEHVFQCHKCRAIHYDEKDPFLCHSCGFCKYAKFDYSIYGRPCCAVDPVESDDDRGKTVQTINNLLEKADKSYRELLTVRQILELLVPKISEHGSVTETLIGNVSSSLHINKIVQHIEKKYCNEAKSHFEDLTKIVLKVQGCRRELVAYDRSQVDAPLSPSAASLEGSDVALSRCYGCALASTEQTLSLLRGMASQMQCRIGLCNEGLVEELALNNLRHGSTQIQDEVRNLLCLLTRDLPEPTQKLSQLLLARVIAALDGSVPFANLDSAVRPEMALLEAMAMQEDSCIQMKLKPIITLFLKASKDERGPANPIIQPCLRVIQFMCSPPAPTSVKNKGKSLQELCTIKPTDGLTLSPKKWMEGDPDHTYEAWIARQPANTSNSDVETAKTTVEAPVAGKMSFISVLDDKRQLIRSRFLIDKYGKRWHYKVLQKQVKHMPLNLIPSYLPSIMFNTNSRLVRQHACALVKSWITTHDRKIHILNLMTSFLKFVGDAGEASADFIELYRGLAKDPPYRQYLALNKVISQIAELVNVEFEKIYRLEETTLSTDMGQGYALKQYVDLISLFLDDPQIRKAYKSVVQSIIQSYLNLRKLVVQRTCFIDEAQKTLMTLLEELTTGTEEETAAFMAICIDIVRNTPANDFKTPFFMFERLCSIIHHEDSDTDDFFLNLEKDQLQEEFIQGRMLGNPYPSSENGLGPLMRDVKNKICFDCEIMAMLEDDNGMELLVHNRIISLDLPVKEVYKRVWLAGGGERDTMRIVYRIRGLSGDATEEFVETLKPVKEEDNEQIYRMVNVVADCGGLKVMLDRMSYLQNVAKSKPFLQTLLKLFLMCVKVKKCREEFCQPELGAINTLLKVLHLCLQVENDPTMATVTEQLLEIMETILAKAASDTLDSFLQFSLTFGGPEFIEALLSCTNHANVRNNPHVLRCLIRVVAALVYGNDIKMALLCDHFNDIFDFDKFDGERTAEEEFQMELFCILCSAIERNSIGGILKDYIMGLGIVDKALEYIVKHAPANRLILLPFATSLDSDELKVFIAKASLKYILLFLSGLATKHEKTQLAVAKDLIPVIHQLEQVSSDEHVGSLAENLLEALSSEPATAKTVQEYRDSTRQEKKKLAMATREKQLLAMGMKTNDKGQVTAKELVLSEMDKLAEETGLTCFICREGYACQPNRVIGIYTFTKRCAVEEFEAKPRKTMGYTTVTHFNIVHIDCHMSAIRMSRSRDEWESASLQNANTKCNGLLPLWGPDVTETAFSACMARHHSYMQDSTQRIEITFTSGIHDLKLLLLRFAQEKTFHDDCGGGGPQSNMHLVPYLMFFALYISLSSRSYAREEKNLTVFLNQPVSEKWLESAYEVEGTIYQTVITLALHTPEMWLKNRIKFLKRLIVTSHVRHLSPGTVCKAFSDKDVKDYSVYKSNLMLFGLVDLIYKNYFSKVVNPKDEDWTVSVFGYIRRNDEAMMKSAVVTLETFRDEYQPCTSFAEFCDVAGLLGEIEDTETFIVDILQSLPNVPS